MTQAQNRDDRGSLWKKWDLHVHTPASIVAAEYGGNGDAAWEKYLAALSALPKDIRVLGINDYIFLDGYYRVHEYWKNGHLPNIELVLPVVELRLDKFGGTESALKRVNYHVIFSDEVPRHAIENQFLARLVARYQLNPNVGDVTWSGSPTRDSLEDLGKEIIASVDKKHRHQYGSPLVEGFNNFNISLDSIEDALAECHYFAKNVITAVGKTEWAAVKWQDGSIAEKKTTINGANFVFVAADSPASAAAAKESLVSGGVNCRLLDCSDAHHYADSAHKDRLGHCYTWIKADTTFQGLQHVLADFDERVYIGDEPPLLARVREHPTRIVDRVTFRKRLGSELSEPWFDGVDLPLNPGLVAIIGNKGSGKSALIDVIGLLGESDRQGHASFLSEQRFRRQPDNKAGEFEATLTWASGLASTRRLDTPVLETAVSKVSYLPQSLFETICNELASTSRGKFDEELKRVIYSHVDEVDRLGHATLDAWISYRSGELVS